MPSISKGMIYIPVQMIQRPARLQTASRLLVLGRDVDLLLSLLNRRLVGPRLARSRFKESVSRCNSSKCEDRRTTKQGCDLEGTLQIALRRLTEDMDLEYLRVVQSLERHDGLNKEWLRILHVHMQESHHRERRVRATDLHTYV